MFEQLEFLLFYSATGLYLVAWVWHLRGWKLDSDAQTRIAVQIRWVGWFLHLLLMGLRWYRAGHVPLLTAFEFVTFFAMLVIGVFLLFAPRKRTGCWAYSCFRSGCC